MQCEPIGYLRTADADKATAPRQGVLAQDTEGVIELVPGRDWRQALEGLEPFARIWIIFHFHRAEDRGNRVQPPGAQRSLGVLATRSPHRPNPIGLTCAELVRIEGSRVVVRGHDLVDATPVLDLKPYLPFADAFPDAHTGWHAGGQPRWTLLHRTTAWNQLTWLEAAGVDLRPRLHTQLALTPLETRNRRLTDHGTHFTLALGTWRVDFEPREPAREVVILRVASGYVRDDSWPDDDRYGDRAVHQAFQSQWG